jgi:hypothetical protein
MEKKTRNKRKEKKRNRQIFEKLNNEKQGELKRHEKIYEKELRNVWYMGELVGSCP